MTTEKAEPVAWRFKHCGEWVLVPWIPAVEHEPLYAAPNRCDAQSAAEPVPDDFDGIGWREYMRGIENGNIDPTGVRLRVLCKIARKNLEALDQLADATSAAIRALSATKPALYNALRDIISIARDAQATDALGDIVKRAEEELGNTKAPDLADTRRDLIALRVKHGADTPLGHRCSNLIGLLENYERARGSDKEIMDRLIMQSMAELAELTK